MPAKRCPNCECIAGPLTVFRYGRRVCEFCHESLTRKGQRWCAVHGVVRDTAKHRCPECRNQRERNQRATNAPQAEKRRAWKRMDYARNPERVLQEQRAWAARNPERARAIRRAKHERYTSKPAVREHLRAASRERHWSNREALLARMRERRRQRKLETFRALFGAR